MKGSVGGFLVLILLVLPAACRQPDFDYYEGFFDRPEFDGVFDRPGIVGGFWKRPHRKQLSFYRGCGTKSEKNSTILINPNYPQPYAGGSRCAYRIYRKSKKICQLRIDFLMLSLAQPTGDGSCSIDYFTVEGGSTAVPRICGENTGQHVYVDVEGKLPLSIVVATTQTRNFNRRWQIQVSQVKCNSKFRAPKGCLQYHQLPVGFIRSFNYAMDEPARLNSIGVMGTRQIANLDYKICIKTQLAKCSITYKRPTSDPYAFTLSEDVKSIDPGLLGTSVLMSQNCGSDYIVIMSPSQVDNTTMTALPGNQFCGLGIADIYSRSQPFTVQVVTNGNETPDLANRGFYLNYSQGICI